VFEDLFGYFVWREHFGYACVIYQDGDWTESVFYGFHHAIDVCGYGDVGLDGDGFAARRANLLADFVCELGLGVVVYGYLGTGVG
jgi:hypothetical protein